VRKLVRDLLEAVGVDGRIILKWILMKDSTKTVLKNRIRAWSGIMWLEDRVKKWAAVNMVMNLQVP
jgi:hypothetical protein